ncbi:MAG: peptidylprolyl isomerase [Planctomycetota bacterium]|jgi:cyclophilin family peptidyl-prolyl cis-trans isomerase
MKTKKSYILVALMIAMVCVSGVVFGASGEKKDVLTTGAKPTSGTVESIFKNDVDKISYIIGVQVATNMMSQDMEVNAKLLIKGIEDILAGKPSLISMSEQKALMMAFQRKMQAKAQEERLKEATKKIDKKSEWKLKLQKPALMTFDSKKDYFWILETSKGLIRVKLMPDVAPMHVTSTIFLTKKGFYDGISFHRVIPGFMAQAGCPLGSGGGGPGYSYDGEFKPNVKHDRPYLLSMANRGPGTDGSQFFLTFKATPWLDGKHTIFGEIVTGQDVMKKLEAAGTPKGTPKERLQIIKAHIEEKQK